MTRSILPASLFLLLAAWGFAQQPPATTWYPFGIDQDGLTGAPDFSFLNHPLAAADRLFVRDGHFYRVGDDGQPNTEDDQRVKLYGVNLAFGANFPTEADAGRIAVRLRKLGVNLVRLHHMDSQPDRDPNTANSLLTQDPYPTLNPVAVRRLRAFLDALKREGIYANLNLKVGYVFRPAVDGVPAPAGSIPTQSKPLHMLDTRMIELQSEFTRKVIDALALNDDPVLGMVEINNESSLVYSWQVGQVDQYVTGPYLAALRTRWNEWLAAKYGSTGALRQAWGATDPDGPSLLGERWTLEVHSPSQATLEGTPATELVVRVARGGAPVIAKQVGFSVDPTSSYVAEVEIRAELNGSETRSVYIDVKQDVSPWNTITSRTVNVSKDWQTVRLAFIPSFAMDRIGRFGISVESTVGVPVRIRNPRLYIAGKRGLDENESIEAANVAVVTGGDSPREARANDYLLFLAGMDREYLDRMLAAVREKAGPLVPVTGTQVGFGGPLNYDSHAGLDYQDNHYYIDHYGFPNVAWDGRDWTFTDTSHVGTGMGTFLNMAATRQAGRPFTLSEYNQPWPNRQAAECDPTLAVFGAFQDWDSIMHFAYSHGRNWDDGVPNGFNVNGDWTKFAGFGQSALLFRAAIAPGTMPVEIPLPLAARLRATREKRNGSLASFLTAWGKYVPQTALVHPVRVAADAGEEAMLPEEALTAAAERPYRADSGEFSYDPDGRVFLVHAPGAAGVIGYAGAKKWTAGAMDVELAAGARGFVALLATALDGQPLEKSGRILVSNPGASLRSQPRVTPVREQRIVAYPGSTTRFTIEPDQTAKPSGDLNGGSRPTWMERVELWLTLRSDAESITVYPLDGAGKRLREIAVERVEGGFRIHVQGEGQEWSPWYEIVR